MSRLKAGDTGYGLKWYWTPWNETDEGALRPDSRFFPFYNFANSFKYGKNIDMLGQPVDYEADERTQNYGPPTLMVGTDSRIHPFSTSGYRGASFSGWPKEQGTNFVNLADQFSELWNRFGRDMASGDFVDKLGDDPGNFEVKDTAAQRAAVNAWNSMNGNERQALFEMIDEKPYLRVTGSLAPIRNLDVAANELFNQMSHMFNRLMVNRELGRRGEPTKRRHAEGIDIMPVLTKIEVPRRSIIRSGVGKDGRAPDDQRDTLAEMTATKYTPKEVIPTSEMIQDRKPWDFEVKNVINDLKPLLDGGGWVYDENLLNDLLYGDESSMKVSEMPEPEWKDMPDAPERLLKYVGEHEPEVREILTRSPVMFHSNFGGYVPRESDSVEDLARRLKNLRENTGILEDPDDFIRRAMLGKRFAYENLYKYFPYEDPKDLSDEHKKKLLKDMSDDEEWREQCSKFKRDFA